MELKDILTISIGLLGVLIGIYQWVKRQKEQKNKIFSKELKKKTDAEIYREDIASKFKYLDFTGLNAILQKPLLLEEIYVKLRAKESFRLAQYHTIADFKELDEEKAQEAEEDFVVIFS